MSALVEGHIRKAARRVGRLCCDLASWTPNPRGPTFISNVVHCQRHRLPFWSRQPNWPVLIEYLKDQTVRGLRSVTILQRFAVALDAIRRIGQKQRGPRAGLQSLNYLRVTFACALQLDGCVIDVFPGD